VNLSLGDFPLVRRTPIALYSRIDEARASDQSSLEHAKIAVRPSKVEGDGHGGVGMKSPKNPFDSGLRHKPDVNPSFFRRRLVQSSIDSRPLRLRVQ
jgi:hypothetical protein